MLNVAEGTIKAARRERRHDRMWTKMYRRDALIAQGYVCAYCHEPQTQTEATADHRDPIIGGCGSTQRKNIKAACKPCNLTKGSMSEAEFLKLIKSPPPGSNFHVWMCWARRKIFLRAERACKRIMECVT